MMSRTAQPVYQVKITLKDVDPPIWRRLLVPLETKLSRFHDIIQAAMGWQDSHLHVFKVGVVNFSYPYEPGHLEELTAVDSRYVKLIHVVPHARPFQREFHFAFEYEYDFGDSWMHEIVFEDVLPPDPEHKAPVCIGGERACPPDDVGGVWGYQNFLEAINDPKHPEYEEYRQWSGGDFDPEKFDLDTVNRAIRTLR